MLIASITVLASWPYLRAQTATTHDVDVAGMDKSAKAGDDFFEYTNGGWFKNAQIPPDRSTAGIWADLTDQASLATRKILDAASNNSGAGSADEKKIGDYYASYMDEAAIEQKGLAPIQALLRDVNAISDRAALTKRLCGDVRADVDPLNNTEYHTDHIFGLWFSQDFNEPSRYAAYMLQGGIGLPDRDYYLDDSPSMQKMRDAYRAHIAATFRLAQIDDPDTKAQKVFDLEKEIAAVHATRTESVDVLKANNPWPRDEFGKRAPGIDWPACFAAAGIDKAPQVIVWHPAAVTAISAIVAKEPVETWRDFIAFHLIDDYGYVLPKPFVDERFGFWGRTMSGTPQIRDRWKRAVDATNGALGDAVGKLYVKQYFPAQDKAQLQRMVQNIIAAFQRRIDALTWMNAKTKAGAKAKLQTLIVGVGYPDKWKDYSGLEVVRGEALMNAWRASLYDYTQERDKLGKPVDRGEWWMTPQTVNAVNLPIQNALNFPAAILKPPFYDPNGSPAMIYGAIGAVIGHEISHSFDDQGAQFDSTGKLRNWWTPEDFKHFQEAGAKLVAQYNQYQPFPDLHVNGQLTLSENIADVAGLSAAYDAYKKSAGAPQKPGPDGLTEDQKFFISYGQTWRTKMRDPLLRQLIVTDGHAPDRYRADTVRNVDAWYTAFNVERGQKLYLAPGERVRVW